MARGKLFPGPLLRELRIPFADDVERRAVGAEYGVEALRLLGWVARVGVAHLPIVMLGLGLAAPSPEVASRKEAAALAGVVDEAEDVVVEVVAYGSRGFEAE